MTSAKKKTKELAEKIAAVFAEDAPLAKAGDAKEGKVKKTTDKSAEKKGGKTLRAKKIKSKNDEENRIIKDKRGAVYVGRLPRGFFEPQLRTFFSQFGAVKRVRLRRNPKTAHSRGAGWVEFELEEVAAIAAKTMNGYFLDGRTIVCNLVDEEKTPHVNKIFKQAGKRLFSRVKVLRRQEEERFNKKAEDGKKVISLQQKQRAVMKKQKTRAKLEALGIKLDG